MKGLFSFLTELTKGLTLYAKTSKQRATVKALKTAATIQKIDKRIKKLREKSQRTNRDLIIIKKLRKKKIELWNLFNYYIAIN